MPIIGSHFNKICLRRERLEAEIKLSRVNLNVTITDVRKKEFVLGKEKKSVAIFAYEFRADYILEKPKGKKLGEIVIEGEIVYLDEEEKIKGIVQKWKEERKIEEEVFKPILQLAIEESQIEAIYLSKKVLLPPPVALPRAKIERPSYIG